MMARVVRARRTQSSTARHRPPAGGAQRLSGQESSACLESSAGGHNKVSDETLTSLDQSLLSCAGENRICLCVEVGGIDVGGGRDRGLTSYR